MKKEWSALIGMNGSRRVVPSSHNVGKERRRKIIGWYTDRTERYSGQPYAYSTVYYISYSFNTVPIGWLPLRLETHTRPDQQLYDLSTIITEVCRLLTPYPSCSKFRNNMTMTIGFSKSLIHFGDRTYNSNSILF